MADEPLIRPTLSGDMPGIASLLQRSFNRINEASFIDAIQATDSYIEDLSLVSAINEHIVGYILLTKIGIRTANEIIPTLTILPFCVDHRMQNRGIGAALLNEALARATEIGYTSCVTLHCGAYFLRHGFVPAREEYGLEVYFQTGDNDFLARELADGALYRKSGFLIFPEVFGRIDPVMLS
jgi:predicted N-acetyltransferase YhbS